MAETLTMYSTTWCGYCSRLKGQLQRAGVPFVEINIETDAEAATFVEHANNGNQTVPTLLLPDGRVLSNPSIRAVLDAIA